MDQKRLEKENKSLRKTIKSLEEQIENFKLDNRQAVVGVLTKIIRSNCKPAHIKTIAESLKEFKKSVNEVDQQLELTEEDVLFIFGDTPFKNDCLNLDELKHVDVESFIDELHFRADTLVKENCRIKKLLIKERYDSKLEYKDLMLEHKDLELKFECLKTGSSKYKADTLEKVKKLQSENNQLKSKNMNLQKENDNFVLEKKDFKIIKKELELQKTKNENLQNKLDEALRKISKLEKNNKK